MVRDQTAPIVAAPSAPVHILVIMMENQGLGQTYNCGSNCANITSLADKFGLAENFSSVAIHSLPDYLTYLNGSNFAYPGSPFPTDCGPPFCRVNGTNILDEISASGRTWRAYIEDYVGGCKFTNLAGHRSVEYDDNHNPFVYMNESRSSTTYCANVVDANPTASGYLALPSKLLSDLNSMTTPAANLIWLSPNNCNSGHDNNATTTFYGGPSICPLSNHVREQNDYLKALVPAILNSATFTTSPSLLFITWDEGSGGACTKTNDPSYPETFPVCIDRVTTIFAGSDALPHHLSNRGYSHYSFLPTIEKVWGLAPLAGQVNGPAFDEFLRPDFELSSSPSSVSISPGSNAISTITVSSISNFGSTITLSASASPSGPAISFTANQLIMSPGERSISKLTVSIPQTTSPGSYSITVTGTNGSASGTHATTIGVTVTTLPPIKSPSLPLLPVSGGIVGGIIVLFTASYVLRRRRNTRHNL